LRSQLSAKGEQECVVVRQRHAVCLARVALNRVDEPVLVVSAGQEPAFASQHLFHDSSKRP
jgi:hypothetical protein